MGVVSLFIFTFTLQCCSANKEVTFLILDENRRNINIPLTIEINGAKAYNDTLRKGNLSMALKTFRFTTKADSISLVFLSDYFQKPKKGIIHLKGKNTTVVVHFSSKYENYKFSEEWIPIPQDTIDEFNFFTDTPRVLL